jgi:hypothetical protein
MTTLSPGQTVEAQLHRTTRRTIGQLSYRRRDVGIDEDPSADDLTRCRASIGIVDLDGNAQVRSFSVGCTASIHAHNSALADHFENVSHA